VNTVENRWTFRNSPKGITTIELVIVVSILATLSAIALPGLLGGVQRSGVDGAARRISDDIRLAQNTAITRGLQTRFIAFSSAGVALNPGASEITDTTKENRYRIEMRSGPSASWPSLGDLPSSNANVLTIWNDLRAYYRGVTVATGNTLIFNSQGFVTNSTSPVDIVVQGSAGTKTIRTSVIGKATIQ
jgi:Tfp pilus assembly protein FimT